MIITAMAYISIWLGIFGSGLDKKLDKFFDRLYYEMQRIKRGM